MIYVMVFITKVLQVHELVWILLQLLLVVMDYDTSCFSSLILMLCILVVVFSVKLLDVVLIFFCVGKFLFVMVFFILEMVL
jgi:hypothetical protein